MKVKVCAGKKCSQKGSKYVIKRLENDKIFYNYPENLIIEPTPCMGNCKNAINIKINEELFENQDPIKASENLKNFLKK